IAGEHRGGDAAVALLDLDLRAGLDMWRRWRVQHDATGGNRRVAVKARRYVRAIRDLAVNQHDPLRPLAIRRQRLREGRVCRYHDGPSPRRWKTTRASTRPPRMRRGGSLSAL